MPEMENLRCSCEFFIEICSIFWCTDVILFMSSTSGTKSPNVLNDALPDIRSLLMIFVANTITNESRAAADAAAPVSPNVLNYALPVGSGLSMVVCGKY